MVAAGNVTSMRPFRYPQYPSQPFTGDLPSMWSPFNRASDTRYSSGTAPYYEQRLMAAHGRQLAGVGEVQDEAAHQGWALNELRLMAEMDDVQANGIFDSPGDPNVPNIYPDAGILAARFSLPGYLARERMYAPSEVRDVTTGRPIIPAPNSPIAYDTSAQVAFVERNMFGVPRPVISARTAAPAAFESTVNVRQNPEPVHGDDGTPLYQKPFFWLGVAAGAAAVAYAMRGR